MGSPTKEGERERKRGRNKVKQNNNLITDQWSYIIIWYLINAIIKLRKVLDNNWIRKATGVAIYVCVCVYLGMQ